MVKIFFITVLIISLFLVVFFKSNALEVNQEVENLDIIKYGVTKYDIHWDRFFDYLKNIPGIIKQGVLSVERSISVTQR